jgi:hypothetical protein
MGFITIPIGRRPDSSETPSVASEKTHAVAVRLIQFVSSLMVGATLVLAPWTPLWENHPALSSSLRLREILMAPWFRGAVTGLGLVNLAAAALDLVRLVSPRSRD